ncbi:MAG: PAS domain S-box protein [Deltaproteobacteria bacterium]|nr:PAS domain S-box protein [Deltaproteobacteria bacterium]
MSRTLIILLGGILLAGAFTTWWTVRQANRYMREDLLYQARLVAQTVDIKRILSLSGSDADLIAADYLRLKEQLACIRKASAGCKFIYLLGRRENGPVFFFVDSEPPGSEDESPAGQIYEEVSSEDLRAFEEKRALTSGPASDRWGTWISALVPLTDPDSDALVAVLGIDFDARDWQRKLKQTALPSILFTLATMALLTVGAYLLNRRTNGDDQPPHHYRYRPIILVIVITGSFLSLSTAWITNGQTIHSRRQAFRQLAQDKASAIAKALHTLRHTELEALARLFEASEYVSPKEFNDYTDYLLKNPVIRTWAWAQWMPASDRERMEEQIRAEGLSEFSIWQRDVNGNRLPVAKRDDGYCPIIRAAPAERKREALGFDLGSDPLRQRALEAAAHSGLTTCSAPIGNPGEPNTPAIIHVFRPIFAQDNASRLRGFALADLQPAALLKSARPTDAVLLELAIGISGTAIETLAASWERGSFPDTRLSVTYPIFEFGQVFLVTAYAGSAFMKLYAFRVAWLVLIAGLMLTILLAGWFGSVHRKREQLERLVEERTRSLVETRNQMELVLHGADLGAWEWCVPSDAMIVNENWAKLIGYRFDEIGPLLENWRGLIAPEDITAANEAMQLHLEGQSDFYEIEHRLLHKAGHYIWVLAKGRVIERDAEGCPLRVCGTCLDTTKHRQVEAALKTSETLLRTLIDTLPDLVWLKDPQGVYLACNKRFERLYGAKEADIIGKTDYDFVDPELADFFRKKDEAAMVAGSACLNEEELTFADDGHRELVETIKTPMVDARGRQIGVLGIARNITDRKRTMEMLRLSEEKFSKIFAMSPDIIAITRLQDGKIMDVNIGFEETTGWKRSEVVGRTSADIQFWADPSAREDMVTELMAGRDVLHREIEFRRKDGNRRIGVYSARMIRISDEVTLIFILQDITKSRSLEAQLQQSQKLEAVGVLAGGVAHDFNNMLGAIIGYAELSMSTLDSSDPMRRNFNKILDAAQRSANLTRQLLAFARKQTIEPVVFDLNASIEGTLKMLRRLIGENIELAWQPTTVKCSVCMDPGQLDQILANLCVNARDAIAEVGKITIKTSTILFDEISCSAYADCVPGEYVRLTIGDDGCGMDRETQDHIFEPFFTTKGIGQGTGLGLATVYGIVKQNQGFIQLYSESGIGTTFDIYLPRHAGGAETAIKDSDDAIPYSQGETILMVEDDPTMREMGLLMLQRLGYTVLPAATPGEAIRMAEDEHTDIQLFITDVVMPEMNGRELADRLLAIRPGMKHLFMSGYTADVIAHQGVLEEGVNFIHKPFTVKDLAVKIRAVLA